MHLNGNIARVDMTRPFQLFECGMKQGPVVHRGVPLTFSLQNSSMECARIVRIDAGQGPSEPWAGQPLGGR